MKTEILITKLPMTHLRKTSLTAGVLYLLTFISIPTLSLYAPVKSANYILTAGPDTTTIIGCLLEIFMALACIGTAVVLYPILKKQHNGMALGLVASRILEAGTIFLGVAFLLTIISLKQSGIGKDALVSSQILVMLYNRIFLLGQSFLPAVNDLLLGILLYKSGLVPRVLALIGVWGAVPLVAGYLAVLFGIIAQNSPWAGLAALLVALFEFSLGIYLVVKGFKNSLLLNNL